MEKRMASGKMPIGQYKNNVTVETCIFYIREYKMSSILGDTADFGRIKKKERFPLLPCLSPQEIEPEDVLFQLQQQFRARFRT
jgi:hypothetical protein